MEGTQQSGVLDFRIFNIVSDQNIMNTARNLALIILEKDSGFEKDINSELRLYLDKLNYHQKDWGRIG